MHHPDPRLVSVILDWPAPSYPVDATGLAHSLGVPIEERRFPPTLWGVTLPSGTVLVNGTLDEARRRFAIVHELGHVVLRRGAAPWVAPNRQELFCDRLARQLLAPVEFLLGSPIELLAARFGVTHDLLHSQLSLAGLGPPIFRTASGAVICRQCGDLLRDRRCDCAKYRIRRPDAAALPPSPDRSRSPVS